MIQIKHIKTNKILFELEQYTGYDNIPQNLLYKSVEVTFDTEIFDYSLTIKTNKFIGYFKIEEGNIIFVDHNVNGPTASDKENEVYYIHNEFLDYDEWLVKARKLKLANLDFQEEIQS